MENIRQAVERAKARGPEPRGSFDAPQRPVAREFGQLQGQHQAQQKIELSPAHLQSRRIVAYDGEDPRSRSFDILRTEVLRSMDLKGWRVLAVTSPTPNCGKTLTAVNLALSIARQPERQVCLVDLDLRKAQIAACLGLKRQQGVVGVVEGHCEFNNAIVETRVGGSKLDVIPTAPSSRSSDLIACAAMKTFLQDVAGHGQSRIVVLDLPPLLTGHDVISILPQVDCVLLVTAVGVSKVSEIEECSKYLQATDIVRFVLNKVPESSAGYYAYY